MPPPAPAATPSDGEAAPSEAAQGAKLQEESEPTRDVAEGGDSGEETRAEDGEIGAGDDDEDADSPSSAATDAAADADAAPPLPNEPTPSDDDGWDCQWDANTQAWFFHNRLTGKTQWENPRVPSSNHPQPQPQPQPQPPAHEKPAAGGYNPAIHGDYDPTAWYAQEAETGADGDAHLAAAEDASAYGATVAFNRFRGDFQGADAAGAERHSDEAKARRQMNAYFDVDAAANAHGGRSLKAERSSKKPTKSELKAFKEKRRARKEEKRRAWLRD